MLFQKGIKTLVHNPGGGNHILTLRRDPAKLQHETFPQITCARTGRVQFLHIMRQDIFHLLHIGVDVIHIEQLIDNSLQVGTQVAGLIKVSDQITGNLGLLVIHVHLAKLLLPLFLYRLVKNALMVAVLLHVRGIRPQNPVFNLPFSRIIVHIVVTVIVILEDFIFRKRPVGKLEWVSIFIKLGERLVGSVRPAVLLVVPISFQCGILIHLLQDFLFQRCIWKFHQLHQPDSLLGGDLSLYRLLFLI